MGEYDTLPAKQAARATAGPSRDDRFGPGEVCTNAQARIIKADVVGERTQITIAKGKSHGARMNMEGYVRAGVDGILSEFQLHDVRDNMSLAFVDVTPDQLAGHLNVIINPTSKPRATLTKDTPTRVLSVTVEGGRTKIIIARGSAHGVTYGMRGQLRAPDGREGESFTIEGTTATQAFAYVANTVDHVQAHQDVVLHPKPSSGAPIQRRAHGAAASGDVQSTAQAGVAGASDRLPHFDTIQRAFGKHDISNIRAQVGGAASGASAALGAQAYATGDKVAFASAPDLHTAAHEAAHTIQQQRGAVGFQGLGAADDEHERHADAVADAVVAGRSAEPLLDKLASGSGGTAVQRKIDEEAEISHAIENSPFAPSVKNRRPVIDWRAGLQKRAMPDGEQTPDCRFDMLEANLAQGASREHDARRPRPARQSRGLDEDVAAWSAIKSATAHAHSVHAVVGADVRSFRDAQNDKELGALLFVSPDKGKTVADFANQQQLPQRGGAKVMELFDDEDQLTLDEEAYAPIHDTSRPRKQTDIAAGATIQSGFGLRAAIIEFDASLEGIKGARAELDGALHTLSSERAADAAAEARREIKDLQDEASELKDIFDLWFGLLSGAAHIAAGEVGDAIDKVGQMASYLMSHVNDRSIALVEQRLRKSEQRMKSERGKALAAMIDAKKSGLQKALLEVERSKERLREANAARRQAYDRLGATAGDEIDGTDDSKRKLSAMLAAIPVVEVVASRARGIATKCQSPAYSEPAGHGLWIAATHGERRVPAFLQAVAEIEGTRDIYARVAGKWERRLEKLRMLEQSVVGRRPGR